MTKVAYQHGFADDQRRQVAALYDHAFGSKLALAIPDHSKRESLLAEAFIPKFSIVAMDSSRVIGIAGYQSSEGSLTGGITFALLVRHLGVGGAIRAAAVLMLYERPFVNGQLLMDGIAVAEDMRGHGIGSTLLSQLRQFAICNRYKAIRLDVIDTNPAAKRLYKRLGFRAVATEHFGYLRQFLGFGSTTQMELPLTQDQPEPLHKT